MRMDENRVPSPTLPEDLAHCIRLLSGNVRELDISQIDLGDNLKKFQQAVEYVTETVCEDNADKLSLAKAASTLYNSGVIWSRIADDNFRLCLRMKEILTTQSSKDGSEEEPEKRKRQPRSQIHPLALPLDDSKAAAHTIHVKDDKLRKASAHKFMATEIPQLPQEKYLAVAQPSSLGLMEHEKIRAYVDDRGNKGADWAEFRINVMKLNQEGYFPLQELHPDEYHSVAIIAPQLGRPSLQDAGMDIELFPERNPANPEQDNIPQDNDMDQLPMDNDIDATMRQEDAPPVNNQNPMPPPKIPLSQGRPDRPHHVPMVPFQKLFSIHTLKQKKDLTDRTSPKDPDNDAVPFRRRNRRIMRKTQPPARAVEVVFFENFWTIPLTDGADGIQCQFGRVLRRYFERLQPLEERARPKRKRGVEPVPVEFTSRTSNAGNPFAPDVPNFQIADEFEDNPGDYEATNLPIDLPNNTIPDAPEHDDLFATMRKEGRFLREVHIENRAPLRELEFDSDVDSDSSRVVHIDQQDWETRLGTFLEIHEPNTLAFNLDEYEKALVVDCHHNREDKQALASVVRKSSIGEVCRSFLSVLDLANKSVMEVGRDEELDFMSLGSQGVEQVMVRVKIESSEMRRFCGTKNPRRTERIEEADETEELPSY